MKKQNLILLLMAVVLSLGPLVLLPNAPFAGADGQAEEVISQLRPDYKPWFQNFWQPPSGEVESLLFALQAALGSGFIGYYLGYLRGKKQAEEKKGHV
ncbi:MAG: energy-coupling factor ABC transporter substrate-binding protein [Bacillota bacterium]|uniref:Cobalt transport protein CbiN n=2 Tax=Carboxydocella TaxID=178898 RepID=A0A1T4QPP6_9FIRM|nr:MULTISPECIES: energy-coupling factor ABC transporter substrate-binding protein [Carboxydocella]AVX21547.1 cobalt/nickel transport protein [Carboxydocella thermautotrophica]AVX32028.1 cobalt/nickel transport protein [Carboxydocella thermautotrophica]SKA05587.1 cobalt/nickel transport protein [Carboxydocella sporoproducens DSM 16521]GAW27740.1 cobalamin biosynthesis protein CbiN [Carboxydocella sp. ULO1]GAW31932.1 cobalamin biosynthesis protein CbiN [Carboxydocella sp. JDF658]